MSRFNCVRFYTQEVEDYRPIKVEEIGPWWCTGYGFEPDTAIIVAYILKDRDVLEWWPEAENVDVMDEDVEPTFTSRFTEPEWWKKSELNTNKENEDD